MNCILKLDFQVGCLKVETHFGNKEKVINQDPRVTSRNVLVETIMLVVSIYPLLTLCWVLCWELKRYLTDVYNNLKCWQLMERLHLREMKQLAQTSLSRQR